MYEAMEYVKKPGGGLKMKHDEGSLVLCTVLDNKIYIMHFQCN